MLSGPGRWLIPITCSCLASSPLFARRGGDERADMRVELRCSHSAIRTGPVFVERPGGLWRREPSRSGSQMPEGLVISCPMIQIEQAEDAGRFCELFAPSRDPIWRTRAVMDQPDGQPEDRLVDCPGDQMMAWEEFRALATVFVGF